MMTNEITHMTSDSEFCLACLAKIFGVFLSTSFSGYNKVCDVFEDRHGLHLRYSNDLI